jgi:CRISPR-associated protein Cmr5
MKLNENIIKCAINALIENKIVIDGTYDSQYNGYISSFGAAVIQSGLISAVIFFENEDASTEKQRHFIIAAIKYLLKEHYGLKISNKLSAHLIDENNTSEILEQITTAATALKLALRTFKKK